MHPILLREDKWQNEKEEFKIILLNFTKFKTLLFILYATNLKYLYNKNVEVYLLIQTGQVPRN